MKLLFDHNLSHKPCARLADLFPDSSQTRFLALQTAPDRMIWEYAKSNGFLVVTLDKDFADIALLRGAPPKIVWLRCGNSTVTAVDRLLRLNFDQIEKFESSPDARVLEIWP
jgi:predicted nuclease of predicted toxin-antitoxin system